MALIADVRLCVRPVLLWLFDVSHIHTNTFSFHDYSLVQEAIKVLYIILAILILGVLCS